MENRISWRRFVVAFLVFGSVLAQGASDEFTYSFEGSDGNLHEVDARKFAEESASHLKEVTKLDEVEETKLNRLLQARRTNASPDVVTWFQFQTPIRNQTDRNTCSIFGMIAAVEARYRRQFGLALDLSEQYAWHMYKSASLSHPKVYQYENQSSFWGGGGGQGVREIWNFAIPLETQAPYRDFASMDALRRTIPAAGALAWVASPTLNLVTQDQVDAFEYSTSYIPTAARQNAKYGVDTYTLLDSATTRNTTRMEDLIAAGNEIIVDAQLNWRLNSTTGILEYDASVAGGAHVFLIAGYDRPRSFFYVKNSWGESNYLKVHYDLFRNASSAGAIVNSVTPPDRPRQKGRFIGVWNMDHDGWKGKLIVRRTTAQSNAATRLGHYIDAEGRRKAVNGVSLESGRGTRFALAATELPTPGDMTGQQFDVHSYSWDVNYASGATVSGGVGYGAFLNRLGFVAPYGSSFTKDKWIGRWNMNHDGWRGTLNITGFTATDGAWNMNATYTDSSGALKTVTGKLDVGREHIARLNVAFGAGGAQPFVLHFHTWNERLFSGYTTSAGATFGAHGIQ